LSSPQPDSSRPGKTNFGPDFVMTEQVKHLARGTLAAPSMTGSPTRNPKSVTLAIVREAVLRIDQ